MRFAADENFNGDILRGLRRLRPDLDLVRIQDVEVYQADDRRVIDWAARESRILLTHDRRTLPDLVYDRVSAGHRTPGVFIVSDQMPVGQAIEDILLILDASDAIEWENRVIFLPL